MRRLLLALVLAACTAVPAWADGKKITVRWFGQSYFQVVSSAGTRVVFDPHLIMSYPRAIVPADLVLISHPHQDHNRVDAIENKERAKVLTGLKQVGTKTDWNEIDEKFKDIKVTSIPLYHDKSFGMERGKNSAFVVVIDELRLVHLGDLGHTLTESQIKAIGPVDVLMIPIGGIYTLNGEEAKKVVAQLKPRRYILPMHYGTKDFDELVGPDEFLDEMKNVEKKLDTNEFVIDADAKPPAEPTTLLLGWKKPE
jgi:L-ascorbate metabolism protein UlaG (beta-lactamase superfamily)